MQIIPFSEQLVSTWSGGTTTQLFIFPPQSSYAERNFRLRISTATINIPTSTFTVLPSFNRILLVLEGNITLHRHGATPIHLKPLQIDRFNGATPTLSEGTGIDFNIIHQPKVDARMCVHHITKGTGLEAYSPEAYTIWYLYSGSGKIINHTTEYWVSARDTIVIKPQESVSFENSDSCILIESQFIP